MDATANSIPDSSDTNRPLIGGLAMLWQAHTYAVSAHINPWEFALEIDALHALGLTVSELRWLVASGFATHGEESPPTAT